ncbi:large ribosomal subunit protein uL1 [Culicoides brevitarsis]|uniref:large ribosomal subunit protein uL1 n=1 Tax=Culicoides brevitarsis TaxID=469753 RepID=UPI00307B869A
MFALLGRTISQIKPVQSCRVISTTVVNPASRKGTREKARLKKVKKEVVKVGFIPHNQRETMKLNVFRPNKHQDDSKRPESPDNVYIGKYYRRPTYSFAEAVQCHRETMHPTMFGYPDAPLLVHIELFMQGIKKTRFVDNFARNAYIPHKYDHGEERNVLVFAKGQEFVQEAQKAGATLAGGPELVRDIQNGKLKLEDYEYVLAHPNILADLVPLRGLLKKLKFPNIKQGTLSPDITEMVERFLNGIKYTAKKDEFQKDFGLVETCIGPLSMPTEHLEQNLVSLLKDIETMRPKRDGKFITRILLKCPPSKEQLKIDPFQYVSETYVKGSDTAAADDDDDEAEDKQEASN